ncbi:PLDc N-terminal domain-containing protein [Microbacterium paraoxydans]|uniref:PLDc N-terminal domain-containing protein n=1 Tax=Microbacterium paraoxydans TaxID=199592 RepID=A0ABS5IL41_9MICO|nr:PLDc N-terminal domain-containing protein [Microbacterium paraoxydans]MBS0023666.1 PLDc N-terminal domain-containing protein [Microbacterium paraoxydans]
MAPYDIVWSIGLVPVLVLMGTALVSLFRRVPRLTLIVSIVWFFVIVLLPVVGPLLWFLFRAVYRKRPEMENT